MDTFYLTKFGAETTMKILKEDEALQAATQKTIVIGDTIDRIIQMLCEAEFIIGDDKAQHQKLRMAQMILSSLIDELRKSDENINN